MAISEHVPKKMPSELRAGEGICGQLIFVRAMVAICQTIDVVSLTSTDVRDHGDDKNEALKQKAVQYKLDLAVRLE